MSELTTSPTLGWSRHIVMLMNASRTRDNTVISSYSGYKVKTYQPPWLPYNGDNCIQNFHFGRSIVGYTMGNLVLQRRDFRTYIRRYTSQNGNFEYGYPRSNALLLSRLKLERCKPHKAAQRRKSSNKM